MVDNEGVQAAAHVVKAAVIVVMEAAMDLIQRDPHQWGTRPCQTCRAVTALLGKPFGCIRWQQENKEG